MNTKTSVPSAAKKSPPQPSGGTHLQAAVILIVGCGAALAFRSDGRSTTAATEAEPLVRRVAPPPAAYERPTTQLLGYVEAETPAGVAARPERRTAAQVDQTASWSQERTSSPPAAPRLTDVRPSETPATNAGAPASAFDDVPSLRTAAAAPSPWALMRPFDAPGSAAASTLSASPANIVRQHTVRDGDTLGDLAERYYGDPRRYRDIFDANRATLTDPQLLPIGTTLVIPAYDPRVTSPPSDPPAARLVPQGIVPRP
jgi:nucleoid-associated protein YgaU